MGCEPKRRHEGRDRDGPGDANSGPGLRRSDFVLGLRRLDIHLSEVATLSDLHLRKLTLVAIGRRDRGPGLETGRSSVGAAAASPGATTGPAQATRPALSSAGDHCAAGRVLCVCVSVTHFYKYPLRKSIHCFTCVSLTQLAKFLNYSITSFLSRALGLMRRFSCPSCVRKTEINATECS